MMPSSIYDLAIENNFPDEEALALYFLDDIPQKEQKKVLALLKKAIGRKDMLKSLRKQQKEYACKPATDKNKKFYAKVLDEIEKTKAWIKTLEK